MALCWSVTGVHNHVPGHTLSILPWQVLASLLLDLRLWAAAPVAVQRSLFALCLKLSQVRLLGQQYPG